MLALLGWNPGTEQELFSIEELVEAFSIERVHKSGSRFDPEKAKWFNHQYLLKRSNEEIAMQFREDLRAKGFQIDLQEIEELVVLVKERISFAKDLWAETDFFFVPPDKYDQDVIKKRWKEDTPALLSELKIVLDNIEAFTPAETEAAVKAWISEKGYNVGNIMSALRLVIVGASRGPHIFDIISWLGKENTIERIDKGLSVIGK
jgi:glutamyl-tRNA synthetase